MNLYFLRLEVIRMLRDPKYLALAVGAPIGFYLLFATLFGGGPAHPGQLKGTVEIMVAMAAYGGIWAVLSTTGPRISEERQIGWLEQLRSMPLAASQVIAAKIVASVVTALPAIVLVCLTAAVVKGVELSPGQWISLVLAMWLGCTAFATLGVTIGFVVGSDFAYPLSYGLYMAMSALGGLWVPPAMLPTTMKDISLWLPTYRLADLGWAIARGNAPSLASIGVLFAWAIGLGLVAYVAYRRPMRVASRRPKLAEVDKLPL
jgi:ABC-2 type transport system permease protein